MRLPIQDQWIVSTGSWQDPKLSNVFEAAVQAAVKAPARATWEAAIAVEKRKMAATAEATAEVGEVPTPLDIEDVMETP